MGDLKRKTRRFVDWDFAALQQSRLYDALMRLPMLIWSIFLGLVTLLSLQQYMRKANPTLPGVVYILNVVMRVSVIAYLVVIAATVVVRTRPVRKASGIEPRISALIGTFLLTAVVLFPRRDLSMIAGLASALLTLAGCAFAVVALTQLRELVPKATAVALLVNPTSREITGAVSNDLRSIARTG